MWIPARLRFKPGVGRNDESGFEVEFFNNLQMCWLLLEKSMKWVLLMGLIAMTAGTNPYFGAEAPRHALTSGADHLTTGQYYSVAVVMSLVGRMPLSTFLPVQHKILLPGLSS